MDHDPRHSTEAGTAGTAGHSLNLLGWIAEYMLLCITRQDTLCASDEILIRRSRPSAMDKRCILGRCRQDRHDLLGI